MLVRLEITYKSGKTINFNDAPVKQQTIEDFMKPILRQNKLKECSPSESRVFIKIFDIEDNDKLIKTLFCVRNVSISKDSLGEDINKNKLFIEEDLTTQSTLNV